MPWDRSAPADPKYRSAEHRRERARWAAVMQRQGYLTCAQPECIEPTRIIECGDYWHLGHDDNGTSYIGPTHATCNRRDGAVRARAKQTRSGLRRWSY